MPTPNCLTSTSGSRPTRGSCRPRPSRASSTTSVRLWDGGAYENLGLESLYKSQQGLLGCDFLICSDASGPIARHVRISFPGPTEGSSGFSPAVRYLQRSNQVAEGEDVH